MFKIDLLKGKGIPVKSKPREAVLIGISFGVPVTVLIVLLGHYLYGEVIASTQKGLVNSYETKLSRLADKLAVQESAEAEIIALNTCLKEVAENIGGHIQWSPILQVVADNMPEALVLEKLEVREESVRREIPRKDDPSKRVPIYINRRVMQISLYGKLGVDNDEAVLQFQQNLRASGMLSPKVDNIKADEKEGLMRYKIECILENEGAPKTL